MVGLAILSRLFNRRFLLSWLPPICLTIGLLVGVHSLVQADPAPTPTELAAYLQNNTPHIGSQTVDSYQQVYYDYTNHSQIFVTNDSYSHIHPVISGHYMAWQAQINGEGQIFLYDMLSQNTMQLTATGTNQNPAIYHNTVTWESWVNNSWQIEHYDGMTITQISSGKAPAVRPNINGQQLIYAEQSGPQSWQALSYDLSSGQSSVLHQGDEASTAYPRFGNSGAISTDVISYYD